MRRHRRGPLYFALTLAGPRGHRISTRWLLLFVLGRRPVVFHGWKIPGAEELL